MTYIAPLGYTYGQFSERCEDVRRRDYVSVTMPRRNFLRWGGIGLLASLAGATTCAPSLAQPQPPEAEDIFVAGVQHCRQPSEDDEPQSLLNCFLRHLPELQLAPRPVSGDSLAQRLELAAALRVELAQLPAEEVIGKALPLTLRYPGWLVAAISIELFELALAHSPLPAFELKGWAYEHVEPHVASIDRALAPLCRLMRSPEAAFTPQLEAAVAEQLDTLRGRLVLLGDKLLVAMAETIRQTLALGDAPVLLRVVGSVSQPEAEASLQYSLAADSPFPGDLTWHFSGTATGWANPERKEIRAGDKVVGALLTAGLLGRCQ